MVEMDGDASREPGAKVARQLQIIARPPAFADKGCRNEEDRPELPLRWLLRESADQNRRADRMTDENRVLVQAREFPLDRRLPCGVTWIVFVRHSRIADLVLRPQLAPEAFDKLVIPFVMDPRTTSLNEEHLAFYTHVTLSDLRGLGLDFNRPVNRHSNRPGTGSARLHAEPRLAVPGPAQAEDPRMSRGRAPRLVNPAGAISQGGRGKGRFRLLTLRPGPKRRPASAVTATGGPATPKTKFCTPTP